MVTQKDSKRKPRNKAVSDRFNAPVLSELRVSGFLSPSGRISIGFLPRDRKKKQDSDYESKCGRIDLVEHTYYDAFEGLKRETVEVVTPSELPELGLSSVLNHQGYCDFSGVSSRDEALKVVKRASCNVRRSQELEKSYYGIGSRGRYGLKGISLNGMRRVREGAYLLQQRYGRRIGFYTLTCPYTVPEHVWSFNESIAEIARRFFQDCKKIYEDLGQVWSNVFVYEYQEERYEESGIPVLHIHYLAPCYLRGTTQWALSATEIRYLWQLSCSQVLGIEADTSASVDAQVIKKTAVGYISKYLSKGGRVVHRLAQTCLSQIPSQWWGMTANVRKAIKRCTTPLPAEVSEYLFGGGGSSPDELLYLPYRRYVDVLIGYDFRDNSPIYDRRGMSARINSLGKLALQRWSKVDLLGL